MHARKPKNLQERFDWYAAAIERAPQELRGLWREKRMPQARLVHLDLGCGKGQWTCAAAKANPQDLWIGFDNETVCIALAAKKAVVEDTIPNVVFSLSDGGALEQTIADGEVDVLHLNFSTPCPRAKYAPLRLTHAARLMEYRRILSDDGRLELKTDSQPFFDWTLHQLEYAGYVVTWSTRDLHADAANSGQTPIDPALVSGYEERLRAKGAKIHALVATPGPAPVELPEQTCAQSLADYLPQDLESLEYVPYGMEEYVTNIINRRRKLARKAQREQRQANGQNTQVSV